MSKYFDRLVELNESLSKELKGFGIVSEDSNSDTIEIPKDSLTDDQKKDILKDNGVDASVVDGMKKSDELDSAMDATLNNDELKNESNNQNFVLRIDDDDLGLHGYVETKGQESGELKVTDEEGGAALFDSEEEALIEKDRICKLFHYDPETITLQNMESDDMDENWVSLNPMEPSSTSTNPIPSI